MKTQTPDTAPLLHQTDPVRANNLSNARLLLTISSCMLIPVLLSLIVLDGLFIWPKVNLLSKSGLYIVTAIFSMFFFVCNFFQVYYAIQDVEKLRSKMMVPALTFGAAALGAAITRLAISSFETGGVLLGATLLQIGYIKGLEWQSKYRFDFNDPADQPKTVIYEYHQV